MQVRQYCRQHAVELVLQCICGKCHAVLMMLAANKPLLAIKGSLLYTAKLAYQKN
jgi:hypothetical protein